MACSRRRRGQFISQRNARPRVRCSARSCVSSRARNRTPLVLMWRALIHEGSRIGMQQKTSRTIHQPRQCSTARSMLCSKLRQHQSPGQNARSHPNQGPSDIADNSSAMAMLDRAFDAMLGAVSDPEPETERPKLPEPGNDLH